MQVAVFNQSSQKSALAVASTRLERLSKQPIPEPEEIITNNRFIWTPSGINCRELQATCEACEIYKLYGRHKNSTDKPCFQAQFNQVLQDRGVEPPASMTAIYKPPVRVQVLSEADGFSLKQEIVSLVCQIDRPTVKKIAARLQEQRFLGREIWPLNLIYGHVGRLLASGVLAYQRVGNGNARVLVCVDESKLDEFRNRKISVPKKCQK